MLCIRSKNDGFTLFELLVVMAIIGITAVVVIPYLKPLSANNETTRITEELRLDLMYARNSAISMGQTITVDPTVDDDWNTGWRIFSPTEELRVKTETADAGVITSNDFDSANPIQFDSRGRASLAGSLNILIPGCTGNNQVTITVNLVGQVIVTEAACP